MSDIEVEPEPEVEHEYCGECGDAIRHEFKCEPGCSENGKDITQRKKMVVAIYKLDRVENKQQPECTCSIDGTPYCKAKGTGYCKAENPS